MDSDTQPYLSVTNTPVLGSIDFNNFLDFYAKLDCIINESGLGHIFAMQFVSATYADKKKQYAKRGREYAMSEKCHNAYLKEGHEAFRCCIIREVEGLSYRKLNVALASNPTLQKFALLDNIVEITVPSKSTLQRYTNLLSCEEFSKIHDRFNVLLFKDKFFIDDLEGGDLYLDATCIGVQMRYPVDWLLVRDGIRTMIKAMILIRSAGIRCRMGDPKEFMSKMNGLCIKMAAANRKVDAAKNRKAVLREMKTLEKTIRKHGISHLELFEKSWEQTKYTQGRAQVITNRLRQTIEIMPKVIFQAHERIIGDRQVKNADKILSLYQDDVHVVTRRKAGAHNEFGSQLLIAEQADGFIVDFNFEKEKISNESKMLPATIAHYKKVFGKAPDSVTTDRGFSAPQVHKLLDDEKVFDAICPKSPAELQERMKDPEFRQKMKRRGPNEGRIGIVKNNFLSGAKKAYTYDRRHKAVCWGILVHNLTKLAKILIEVDKLEEVA
jgi:hypothetical protein